jgi:lipopolysaccharide export LptBFGC system permease protein LptF
LILSLATDAAGAPAYFVVMALPQFAFAAAAVVALRRPAGQSS